MIEKIKDDWFNFGMSYFCIAEIACREIIEKEKPEYSILDLYIAIIYNVKHGIEVSLKSFVVHLEDKQLKKQLEHHDQMEILMEILRLIKKKKILSLVKKLSKEYEDKDEWLFKRSEKIGPSLLKIMDIVSRYHSCDFLKEKIGLDFEIKDVRNTAFKYPKNNILIELDYGKILKKITKKDVEQVALDIVNLMNSFFTFKILFVRFENEEIKKKIKNRS